MSTKIFGLADLPVGTIADAVQINSNGRVPLPEILPKEVQDFKNSISGNNLEQMHSDQINIPKKNRL